MHCLSFWNQEAQKMFVPNADEGETLQQLALCCIAADCMAFVMPLCGFVYDEQGRQARMVSHKGTEERILLIQFLEDQV